METIILNCLQAQLMITRINERALMPAYIKNDLIWEVKQIAPKECKYDKRTERSTKPDA